MLQPIKRLHCRKHSVFRYSVRVKQNGTGKKKEDVSLEANDLVSGQFNELVEVKADVLPPVASVSAVGVSRIAGTSWKRRAIIKMERFSSFIRNSNTEKRLMANTEAFKEPG